jgi:hypothetical protein
MSCDKKVFPYKLNFECPSSETFLRFIFDSTRNGKVTDGIKDLVKIDLSQYFKPLEKFKYVTYNLSPNEEILIEVSDISTTGKRHQISEIDFSSFSSYITINQIVLNFTGTLFSFSYVKTIILTSTINSFADLSNLLKTEIQNDSILQSLVTVSSIDLTNNKITLKGLNIGKDFNVTINFIGTATTTIGTFTDTKIYTAIKYPNKNVIDFLFLIVEYCNDCEESYKKMQWRFYSDPITNWKKMGNMLVLSSTNDYLETDENLFETIYIKNISQCNVKIYGIVGI